MKMKSSDPEVTFDFCFVLLEYFIFKLLIFCYIIGNQRKEDEVWETKVYIYTVCMIHDFSKYCF